jgi:hypothetical protein
LNYSTRAAFLRRSRRRPRARPADGGVGAGCWIGTTFLRNSRRRPRARPAGGVGGVSGRTWTPPPPPPLNLPLLLLPHLLHLFLLPILPPLSLLPLSPPPPLHPLSPFSPPAPLPSAFAAVPGPRSRGAGWGRTAGPGLLFCAILAAVPGPGPGMAGGGEDCWTWPAPRPPRAWGASPLRARLPPLHTFTHHFIPPSPSLCTFIIIPPAAIVKPQGFLARGFPPRRAAGVHSHLTLSHASHHPTNLSDSPPAGMDTCCLSPLEQETPSEPPRWSVLPSPPPAASPRCWVRLDVSSDVRVGVPPRCCRRGGRGLSDCTTTPPPHSIPPHINPPHTPYHTHALHTPLYSRTLAPSREAKLSSTVVSSLPHLIL